MPRVRNYGDKGSRVISFKLDEESDTFYRQKANEAGLTLSEYLRQTLTRGVISENVRALEGRLQALFEGKSGDSGDAGDSENSGLGVSGMDAGVSRELLRSMFFCEAVLADVMGDRSPEQLSAAHARADRKAKQVVGGEHG